MQFWVDVVTVRPEGYVEDAEGNVEITTAEGMAWLISEVNGFNGCAGNDFSGRTVTLKNDIDMSAWTWVSIGIDEQHGFSGSFHGSGNTIEGIHLDYHAISQPYAGMFGCIKHATVSDLVLRSGNIVGDSYVGGIAGLSDSMSMVNNCVVDVEVDGSDKTGGVVGVNKNSTIRNCCYVAEEIGLYENYAGGISGVNYADYSDAEVRNCYVLSSFICSYSTKYAGGLVGWNGTSEGSDKKAVVENGYATSDDIYGYAQYIGGVVGQNEHGDVLYCYSSEINNQSTFPPVGMDNGNTRNCTNFAIGEGANTLFEAITINGTSTNDLLEALNLWVTNQSDITLFAKWHNDASSGMPVFDAFRYSEGVYTHEPISSAVEIFPNPASNTVAVSGIDVDQITIFDNMGNIVKLHENGNVVNVSTLSNGMYHLVILSKQGTIHKKQLIIVR